MCGIAGFVDAPSGGGDDATLTRTARAMADRLWHRGPDAGGAWADAAAGVALGHRRLSIIDLSEAGAQPMTSRDGRLVVSYNGEVYNAPDLRAELEAAGVRFRGTLRYRSARGSLRPLGRARDAGPPGGHVRLRAVGYP